MKNFFKKLFSDPKIKVLREVLLVITFLALFMFMLYGFSVLLLLGIEESSATNIAIAFTGYISITVLAVFIIFWKVFADSYDYELLRLRRDIAEIRYKQSLESLENSFTRLHVENSLLELKYDIKDMFDDIKKKLDNPKV